MFAAVDVLCLYQFTLFCVWACTTVSGFIYVRQCKSISHRKYISSLSVTMLTLYSRLFNQECSHLSILSSEGWPVRHNHISVTAKFEHNSVSAWWNLVWTVQYMIGYIACLSERCHQSCTINYCLKLFFFLFLYCKELFFSNSSNVHVVMVTNCSLWETHILSKFSVTVLCWQIFVIFDITQLINGYLSACIMPCPKFFMLETGKNVSVYSIVGVTDGLIFETWWVVSFACKECCVD